MCVQLTTVAEERRRGGQPVELVVDGRTLTNLLGDKEAEEALADLGSKCSAVVVCRASPLQKANIVTMMSEYEMRLVAGKHSTPIGRWLARRRRKLAVRFPLQQPLCALLSPFCPAHC